jgi:hypothetical protein
MPDPKDYKKSEKAKYMDDCMHQTVKVEKKTRDQGVAQCLAVWREHHEEKPERKKSGTHIILKILAQRLAEYA